MAKSKMSRRQFLAKSALGAAAVGSAAALSSSKVHGANDRISIGVIGAGRQGYSLMGVVHRLREDYNVEITAICDTWRPRADHMTAKANEWYGGDCRKFTDYVDLLALDDVDAVIIATPDFAHSKILADAMKAGKDAYVEKPMATELEDAKAALDAAKASNRIVQVGTQRRSDGIWKAGAKAIQSGALGTISRVEIAWNDCGPRWRRRFSDLREEDVNWKRYLMGLPYRPFDPSQYRQWHLYRDFTNGVIGLLGSHYLDVVAWFMDDPFPSTAVAHGGNYVWQDGREQEDTVYALYDYPKGFMCEYLTGLGNAAESGVRIYGTRGMFSTSTWTLTGAGARGDDVIKEKIKIEREPGEDPVVDWLKCMRTREPTTAPVETGYQHSVACILGYQALISGRKMKYLPTLRRIVEAPVASA